MVKHHLLKSFKSFTLIELIVVLTIMSILSLIWVLFLSNWLWLSKDSRKISDLNIIKKSLDIYITTNWVDNYPLPDNPVQILDNNNQTVWYQWVFWVNATTNVSSLKNPIFDSDWNYYEYSVTSDMKYYQVRTYLDKNNDYFSLLWKTHAQDWINKTVGSFNWWIILKNDSNYTLRNIPSLFIKNPIKSSWIEYLYLSDINNSFYVPNSIVNLPVNSIKSYDITDFVLSWDITCVSKALDYFQKEDVSLSSFLNLLKNSSWSSFIANKNYFEIKTLFNKKEIEQFIDVDNNWTYTIPDYLKIDNHSENTDIVIKRPIENWQLSKSLTLKNDNWILSWIFSKEIPSCLKHTEWDWFQCVIVNCKWLYDKWFINNWYYNIDIDWVWPVAPINVYCDMENSWLLYAANPYDSLWYWTFNNTFSDRSPNKRHWEVKWNPEFTQWIIWSAIKLNWTQVMGNNYDWIDIEDILLNNLSSWTISAWIKIDSDSYWKDNTMSLLWSNSSYSVISTAQWISNWYKDWEWNRYNWFNSISTKSNNWWIHSSWSSDWNKFYSYINWEKIWEVNISNSLLEIIWIWVWYKTDNYISTWDWYIDDLVIFKRKLNSDEIKNIYKLGVQWIWFWE